MYHIPKDKRAYKSVKLIENSLKICQKKKSFKDITVTDICNECGISRTTFYRLFDIPDDIFAYRFHIAFDEIREGMKEQKFKSQREALIYFFNGWIKHDDILEIIVNNDLRNIIFQELLNNTDVIESTITGYISMSKSQKDYLIAIIAGITPSVFQIWYRHNKKESSEEILSHMINAFEALIC